MLIKKVCSLFQKQFSIFPFTRSVYREYYKFLNITHFSSAYFSARFQRWQCKSILFFFTTHVPCFLYQNTNFTFSVFLPFFSFVNFLRWKNNIKQNSRSYYERRWTWSYGNPGCPGRGQMRIPREILTSARLWNDQIQKRLGFTH